MWHMMYLNAAYVLSARRPVLARRWSLRRRASTPSHAVLGEIRSSISGTDSSFPCMLSPAHLLHSWNGKKPSGPKSITSGGSPQWLLCLFTAPAGGGAYCGVAASVNPADHHRTRVLLRSVEGEQRRSSSANVQVFFYYSRQMVFY